MNDVILYGLIALGVAALVTVIVILVGRVMAADKVLDAQLRDQPWNDGRYDGLEGDPVPARQHIANRESQGSDS